MASPPRIEIVGATYHLNTKAVAGLRAFPDHAHRDAFMRFLREEVELSKWICLGYTVLGTHYHLLIKLKKATLSSGFQRLNSSYARWFNRKHGRTGALWQARFFDVPVESAFQLLEAQRYLAFNAPHAGLVENPEDWQYCHYGSLVGRFQRDSIVDEDAILRVVSRDRRRARAKLRALVEEEDSRRRLELFLRGASEAAWRAPATSRA